MTRLEFHADQSAKRRKLLLVDPFEVDDTNDGIEKLTIFRVRKSEARPMYEYSTWGRMLMNPRTQDSTDKKGGVLFRRRFRVPFPVFLRLVALRERTTGSQKDLMPLVEEGLRLSSKYLEFYVFWDEDTALMGLRNYHLSVQNAIGCSFTPSVICFRRSTLMFTAMHL